MIERFTRRGRCHRWIWPPPGVTLGDDYPAPIVDHAAAAAETLVVYRAALDEANDRAK